MSFHAKVTLFPMVWCVSSYSVGDPGLLNVSVEWERALLCCTERLFILSVWFQEGPEIKAGGKVKHGVGKTAKGG